MGKTAIEWTDYTFNPWRGCSKVAAGCEHCYAERLAKRQPEVFGTWGPDGKRVIASESYWRQPIAWNRAAEKSGVRRRVFCGSMMDVLEDRGDLIPPRGDLWSLISATPCLDWLLLTKRPENARLFWPWMNFAGDKLADPPPNLWLGTSVSTQADADRAIPHVLRCPATVRFLSVEPMLEPLDLTAWLNCYVPDTARRRKAERWLGPFIQSARTCHLHLVIVGGESGPKARPCRVEWIRSIVRQCQAAGVPVFVKQLGARAIAWNQYTDRLGGITGGRGDYCFPTEDPKGGDPEEWPEDIRVREFPEVP